MVTLTPIAYFSPAERAAIFCKVRRISGRVGVEHHEVGVQSGGQAAPAIGFFPSRCGRGSERGEYLHCRQARS